MGGVVADPPAFIFCMSRRASGTLRSWRNAEGKSSLVIIWSVSSGYHGNLDAQVGISAALGEESRHALEAQTPKDVNTLQNKIIKQTKKKTR